MEERTFEEAFEEAKKYMHKITVCFEYKEAYEFGDDTEIRFDDGYLYVWKDKAKEPMYQHIYLRERYAMGLPADGDPIKETRLNWER